MQYMRGYKCFIGQSVVKVGNIEGTYWSLVYMALVLVFRRLSEVCDLAVMISSWGWDEE